jgi:eukaryotic-like serine/threonine-protein kinase
VGDLATTIREQGPIPAEQAARIGAQVADGLAFAHRKGVIHRDVKPSNILLAADRTPKIVDFGIARVAGSGTATLAGTVMGSPHYMSPEQASGREADERSDVYAMGVTLFEMVSGERPFDGDVVMLLSQHLNRPAPRLPPSTGTAAEGLEGIILRMLEKDPARRPATMEETAGLLLSLCERAGAATARR